jgi:redox-sensitive bicupin YhaK (pirin superfamily)
MIELRKASGRFRTRLDWLDSRHSFSFGHHFDSARMGHGPLRVVNEDWISPRSGFPTHGHRDMEILSWVLSGTLTHRDSEGNRAEIRPGRVQLMHAGRGISHSELNLDQSEPVHLLQIWIEPERKGAPPGHAFVDVALEPGRPSVLASYGASEGGLAIRNEVTVSALRLRPGEGFDGRWDAGRSGWVQVARGAGRSGSFPLSAGDALALDRVEALNLEGGGETGIELLLFDLPGRSRVARVAGSAGDTDRGGIARQTFKTEREEGGHGSAGRG